MNKKVAFAAIAAASVVLAVGGLTRVLPPPTAAAKSPEPKPVQPKGSPAPAPPAGAQVEDPKAVYRVPLDGSAVRGSADALVTIVEVGDLECPYCKRVAPTLRQIEQDYRGKIRFVYKHNPLPMHAGALPAAFLTEEARAQKGDDAFWAARDRILDLPKLDRPALEGVARALGLDAKRVEAALVGNPAHYERVRRDQNLAFSLAARATPTFFVNGRKLVGAQPVAALKALVDEELARAGALVKQGVRPEDVYARIVEKGATAPVMIAAPGQPAPAAAGPAGKIAVRGDDPVKGPSAAPVTVVLFSDFQCPFCARVEPTLKQLAQAYPKDVRIAWKHLPLPFHPNALPAAKAAEAARAQGKFWEMHDKLFEGQQALSDEAYLRAAKELGLDRARFKKDLASEAATRRISEDGALGAANGATGTPTLFVNCRKIVGAQPLEAFKKLVDEELAKAKGQQVDAGWYDRACAANVAAAPPAAPAQGADVRIALRPDDPARGGRDAKVTVVEFSDFQCPFCSRAVPAVKQLEKEFPGEVRVVWKHLPLPFHPNAMPAAIAAEAARQQGKFWEMHDRLFEGQQSLSDAAYTKNAKDLGLDLGRFERAMKDPATRARVEEDAKAAAAAGVSGTPTFLVDGERVVGAGGLGDAVRRHLQNARGTKG
jgi:protein-disulfide isomerase